MTAVGQGAERRRLILLFDGTWNDVVLTRWDTNIVRLRDIIDATLREQEDRKTPPARRTYVFYRRGVGTDDLVDRIRGGAFGVGVTANVRRGYRFLSRHYRPGDEIFVFGFSRGAFTARSLVGFLSTAGLLRSDRCTPEREAAAWAHYRAAPDDRLPGDWHALTPHVHPRGEFRVSALCVFDTVGALGIPLTPFRRLNRSRQEFHNVELPSITDVNLHAVAIDERRQAFTPTLWRENKFKRMELQQQTEQVWFPGVHADVGGGYFDAEARGEGFWGLDDLPLDWMLRRLRHWFDDFPCPKGLQPSPPREVALALQHDSRGIAYRLRRPGQRAIANADPATPWWVSLVGRDRLERTAREMVHVSAIERLGEVVRCEGSAIVYAPPSLVALLPALEAGCWAPAPHAEGPNLVWWDGEPVWLRSPHAAAAQRCLAQATERLRARGMLPA